MLLKPIPWKLDTVGERGFYRPSGRVSAGQLADLVAEALDGARVAGLRDVLINLTELTGFESPGQAYRRWVAGRWAKAAAGALSVAVVARREHICPQRSGLLAAARKGLKAHICERESEAMDWLHETAQSRSARGDTFGKDRASENAARLEQSFKALPSQRRR
jgi:hypothetical protein